MIYIYVTKKIKKATSNIDQAVAYAGCKIALIREWRARLISDAVTGKVDVQSVIVPEFEDENDLEDIPPDDESEDEA